MGSNHRHLFGKGLKMVNIPHGVDLNKFSAKLKKIEIALEKPIILCVSSLDPYKRVNLAVEAVSKMKKGSLFAKILLLLEKQQRKTLKISRQV